MTSLDPCSGPAEPLRVLQVNSLLTGGGTDDQSLRLARGLLDLNQALWFAAPPGRELTPLARELQIPLLNTPPASGPLKLRFIRAIARHTRQHRIQILHGHHGRDLWPTVFAAAWSGVRPAVVLSRHLAKSPASFASRRFLLGRCDALIAVSGFVAKVLREGSYDPASPVEERRLRPPMQGDHRKIRVVHGGIDPNRFRPADATFQRRAWGLADSDVAFGVVGGYDLPRGKGQREFLLAAAQVARRVPSARFLVIGRGNMAEVLRQDIQRLDLEGRAQLTAYSEDMPAAMNALDCLVHPQIATDAFPTVVLEALACGKPVIATRCDGVPEQVIDGEVGLLVPMEDVQALALAMERLARDPPLRKRLGGAGRSRVLEHFTLERMAREVLAVYRELKPPRAAE
jgi:glycosyltransferase involved in cell wall biosynthesis